MRKTDSGGGSRCYLVGAGERTEEQITPMPGDLVIAADGGKAWLAELGIVPDLLVGDFDSLGETPVGPAVVRLPVEKDDTDMMAAARLGIERGYRRFHIYGGAGGRFDHTLANLQILTWLARRGCENILYGPGWAASAVSGGTLRLEARACGMVSVFCQGDAARGVTLEGLKYPLAGAALTCDFPLGVSNEFIGAPVRVTVEEGTLLVVWER